MEKERRRFVIEAEDAKSTAERAGLTITQVLPSILERYRPLARAPISSFHVAAAASSLDGRIFIGVNVEFPGLPLHHSIHAEQFLVVNAAVHGCAGLRHIAVSAAPCGHCRQFLQELPGPSDISIFIASSDGGDLSLLSDLLPRSFGPSDLLESALPLLLHTRSAPLSLISPLLLEESWKEVVRRAKEAAEESYAPYSGCRSGAAVVGTNGRVHRGSYIESAAYNPSVGPVQAALVAYMVESNNGDFEGIVRAVVAERADAVVRQADTARLLLRAVSPKCEVKVVHFL